LADLRGKQYQIVKSLFRQGVQHVVIVQNREAVGFIFW